MPACDIHRGRRGEGRMKKDARRSHRLTKMNYPRLLDLNLLTLLVLGAMLHFGACQDHNTSTSCSAKLRNCESQVQPFVRDVRYMFPTSISEIDQMCKIWSNFVDCIRRYVTGCFNEQKRAKFNQAVENSVDTVHAICSSETVQREYLSNAECFRKSSVEFCGASYSQLIDHVSDPRSTDDHICCSYGYFKNCVHDPLLRECGHRAKNLMVNSLGFLVKSCGEMQLSDTRCSSLVPLTRDTTSTGHRMDRSLEADHTQPTESHYVYPDAAGRTSNSPLPNSLKISLTTLTMTYILTHTVSLTTIYLL